MTAVGHCSGGVLSSRSRTNFQVEDLGWFGAIFFFAVVVAGNLKTTVSRIAEAVVETAVI
jgi:hypothetical protein